jgi:ATP-binding cassette subfamily B protein
MRLIGRSFRAHPIPHAIAIVGAVLFAISMVALSRALGWVTDELIVPGLGGDGVGNDRLVTGFLIIFVIAVVRGAGAIVRRYFLSMAESRTQGTWRSQIYSQYLKQPLEFHRSTSTGQLIAHADNDLVVAGTVLRPLAFAIATVVLALLAIISLSLVHWAFGVVAVFVLPILFFLNRSFSSRVAGPAADVQEAIAEVTGVAHESFDGVMVVKTLGRTNDEVERMRVVSASLREKRLVVGRLRAVFEPLLEMLPNLGIIVLLLIGASLVANESVTVGELVGAMSLFSVLGLPIRIVGFFLQSMPASVVALDRIDSVLDLPVPDDHAGTVAALPDGAVALEFANVTFTHGSNTQEANTVLDGFDLRIEAGERMALVGVTGSGKTTILELAAGLVPPDSGDISLAGVRYNDLQPHARAKRLGMVFQETFLFAQSIRENITMGDEWEPGELEAAARAAQAHDFIMETPEGYDTVVGERGVTLSGGQRQRVALARAMFRSPSLMLLDDATSAVDPTIEREILRSIDGDDMTVLMVAHRLSTIMLADRIAYLEGAKIVAVGSHEELLQHDGYKTLVQAYEGAGT